MGRGEKKAELAQSQGQNPGSATRVENEGLGGRNASYPKGMGVLGYG